MFFIGVTTSRSAIRSVFPVWARQLQLGECCLQGIDLPLNAEPQQYREAIELVREHPTAVGALVTSHKVKVFATCADQFHQMDGCAHAIGEVSSIRKRGGRLIGRATDPVAVACALRNIVRQDAVLDSADVLILGAGGAGTAFTYHLSVEREVVGRIVVADCSVPAIERLKTLHGGWRNARPISLHVISTPGAADVLVRTLSAGSIIVNATGLGKDLPGSPLSDDCVFPNRSVAWDFNYRGELVFLEQARRRQPVDHLRIHDGWEYFLHGWRCVMADVFDTEIPAAGVLFATLAQLAATAR